MGQKIPRVMNFYKRFSRNIRSFLVENKIDMDTHIRKLSTDYRHTIQRFTEQIKVVRLFFSKEEMVENLQKKRYTIKSYRKRCKEYEENIRRYQDKYIRTFLSILRERKIYDLPDEKPVKESISFRR